MLILSTFFFYSCHDTPGSISSALADQSVSAADPSGNHLSALNKAKGLTMNVLESTGTEFKVFDGMGYRGKPDMSKFGIRPIDVIYTNDLWHNKRTKKNKWQFVSESRAARLAKKAAKLKSRAVMVDVQNWPTDKDDKTTLKSVRRLNTLYYDLKRAAPNTDFGYFNKIPLKVWWGNPPNKNSFKRLRKRNDRLEGTAGKVDIMYVTGYAKSKDWDRWRTNIKNIVAEAKRIGKDQPIYLVLWPQYPPRTSKNLRGNYINKKYWKFQLETAKKYADGIVLYAPHGARWNGSADWWKATKQFMDDLGDYSIQPKVSDSQFKVFDGTRFRNKPKMSRFGFTPIRVVYDFLLHDKPMSRVGDWELPSKKRVVEWAHKASKVNSKISMINIERWPTNEDDITSGNVGMSINKYSKVYDWFKEAEPNMDFGYYKTLPHKVHWTTYPQPHWISSVTKTNKRLRPLADKVDTYFLSEYARSKDKKGWVINAKYNIKQANKYGGQNPVYLVLHPQYHAKNNSSLDDQYIERDFWKLQLETARRYADGVLIWFPYDTKWSEASNKAWWGVTKRFLRNMKNDK